jgi:SH3-like domain-containing protein
MDLIRATTRLLSIAGISLALALAISPAHAEMVSIKGSVVNMRSGPSTNSEVLWELERGYPLRVISRKGSWVQVQDFENDKGWVASSLTGKTPHHIVKARIANIRSGPGTGYRVVGKAERYDLMRTRGSKSGWIRVESRSGVKGWMSKRLLWGW